MTVYGGQASRGTSWRPARWQVSLVIAVLALVAVIYSVSRHGRITVDGSKLNGTLTSWLTDHGELSSVLVTCPESPSGKAGYVFICSVYGSGDVSGMRVVIDNSHGDLEWTPIPK